jgi:hypothetical protein
MEPNKKQTAVEWFIEELFKKIDYTQVPQKLIDQAKQMDKEQMIEFAQEVFRNRYNQIHQSLSNIADDIYNETYGGK